MRHLLVLLLIAFATLAHAADYGREQRWADEVVPGIVVGDAVWLEAAGRKFLGILTPAKDAKGAVIVVHGSGIHPDWGLNGTLRAALAERGYTTLSIQMPVLAADAKHDEYPATFPEAGARIAAAIAYLQGQGAKKTAIVSHSMGSRMVNDFIVGKPDAPLFAWVSLGISSGELRPAPIRYPVLDLYGETDFPQVVAGAPKRADWIRGIKGSAQIMIPGADHFFAGKESAMTDAVAVFLNRAVGR